MADLGDMLLRLAHAWEARAVSGSGFAIELDPTWIAAARELRQLVAMSALLAFVGRCNRRLVA